MITLILLVAATRIQGDQIRIPPSTRGITIDQALKLKNQLACNVEVTQDGTGVIVYPQPDCAARARLSTAAWAVINTHCTRCHGADLIPGDVSLVGGLDMRTRKAMLKGGKHGPALKPGDLMGSLIYRYVTRHAWSTLEVPSGGMSPQSPLMRVLTPTSDEVSVAMPPYAQLSETKIIALRDWILAGAP